MAPMYALITVANDAHDSSVPSKDLGFPKRRVSTKPERAEDVAASCRAVAASWRATLSSAV